MAVTCVAYAMIYCCVIRPINQGRTGGLDLKTSPSVNVDTDGVPVFGAYFALRSGGEVHRFLRCGPCGKACGRLMPPLRVLS
jgi:hypothetical protein